MSAELKRSQQKSRDFISNATDKRKIHLQLPKVINKSIKIVEKRHNNNKMSVEEEVLRIHKKMSKMTTSGTVNKANDSK